MTSLSQDQPCDHLHPEFLPNEFPMTKPLSVFVFVLYLQPKTSKWHVYSTVELHCVSLLPGCVLCLLLPLRARPPLEAWHRSILSLITFYSSDLSSPPDRSSLKPETVSALPLFKQGPSLAHRSCHIARQLHLISPPACEAILAFLGALTKPHKGCHTIGWIHLETFILFSLSGS